MSKKAEEKAVDAWAVYEYREHPKGLYHTGFVDGYKEGYEHGEKDTIERAIKWLMDRVNIPCDVETNEEGEPLADSYIDYAKKRLEAANEIAEDFRKAME